MSSAGAPSLCSTRWPNSIRLWRETASCKNERLERLGLGRGSREPDRSAGWEP